MLLACEAVDYLNNRRKFPGHDLKSSERRTFEEYPLDVERMLSPLRSALVPAQWCPQLLLLEFVPVQLAELGGKYFWLFLKKNVSPWDRFKRKYTDTAELNISLRTVAANNASEKGANFRQTQAYH